MEQSNFYDFKESSPSSDSNSKESSPSSDSNSKESSPSSDSNSKESSSWDWFQEIHYPILDYIFLLLSFQEKINLSLVSTFLRKKYNDNISKYNPELAIVKNNKYGNLDSIFLEINSKKLNINKMIKYCCSQDNHNLYQLLTNKSNYNYENDLSLSIVFSSINVFQNIFNKYLKDIYLNKILLIVEDIEKYQSIKILQILINNINDSIIINQIYIYLFQKENQWIEGIKIVTNSPYFKFSPKIAESYSNKDTISLMIDKVNENVIETLIGLCINNLDLFNLLKLKLYNNKLFLKYISNKKNFKNFVNSNKFWISFLKLD